MCVRLSTVSLAQTHIQWQVILRQTPCRGSRDAESFKSTVPWSNNVKTQVSLYEHLELLQQKLLELTDFVCNH